MKLRLHGANFTIADIKNVQAGSNYEVRRESGSGCLGKMLTDKNVHGSVIAFPRNEPEVLA